MKPVRTALSRSALVVAPRLLGAIVVSELADRTVAVRLTEVEAYQGPADPASHAFRGLTPRTAVMFGPPGHLYVYFTYGMHWCANVVCGADGTASAVLLRAGEVLTGVDAARARRPAARSEVELARGPARLAACLGLIGDHNGIDLLDARSPVRIDSMASRRPRGVETGPRVGIRAAAQRPWRFWLAGDPTVSVYRAGGRKRLRSDPADLQA
jgi:DNA-3-methyladenine glycosylase